MENDESDYSDDGQPKDFQMRPTLEEKFKPLVVKEIVDNVLFDELSSKTYNDVIENQGYLHYLANKIKERLKGVISNRYRFVVNVVLGQNNGAGFKLGSRCLWDAETDECIHANFTKDTLFCIAVIYAAYNY